MPELVKLNRTEVYPEVRAIEHLAHSRLAWSRKDKGEFFRCEVATAVRTTQAFHVPSDALCGACDG